MKVKIVRKKDGFWFDERFLDKICKVLREDEDYYEVGFKNFDKDGSYSQTIPKECCEVIKK